MAVIKVYGETWAVCPQRVMICLVEKGIPFEVVHVNLDLMENKRPEYMEKQPFGQVPYIVDGDFGLYESRAIIRYLAAKYAEYGTGLLGRTPEERARVDQWLDVEAINYNPLVFSIVLNQSILPMRGLPGNKAEVLACLEKLEDVLQVYEKQLSKTKYLAGDEFTLADLTLLPATHYMLENCGMASLFDDKKHIKAWWESISGRPTWKKLMSFVKSGALSYSP